MFLETFGEVADLFPSWCEDLTIFYETSECLETIVTCQPKHEYRFMAITVRPLFFEQKDDGLSALIHEIQHALVRPYIARVDKIIHRFIDNETISHYLTDELTEAEEAICEDLTRFAQKLRSKRPTRK